MTWLRPSRTGGSETGRSFHPVCVTFTPEVCLVRQGACLSHGRFGETRLATLILRSRIDCFALSSTSLAGVSDGVTKCAKHELNGACAACWLDAVIFVQGGKPPAAATPFIWAFDLRMAHDDRGERRVGQLHRWTPLSCRVF
ncbi:unnamed protein product [Scytosiphon promiscuus]